MAASILNPVLDELRRTVLLRDGAGLTDGQLLESFVSRGDEAAFEELVRRHGPMVLGVCRRVLRHHHDAEDAFQATFLVLARKAGSVRPREMVARWLYGVAYRTALKARGLIARRRVRERPVAEVPEPEAAEADAGWRDLRPLLDRELSRLPDKYRVPIVLCDLEGKAGKEAARQLGWPAGTVASRLSRGRVLLARRLTRHGLALSGGLLAATLSERAAPARVPAALVSTTVKAAGSMAAGQTAAAGLTSAHVAALTEGVLNAMFLTKLKTGVALVLAAAALTAGLGVALTHRTEAAGPAQATREAAPKSDKDRLQGTWRQVFAEGKEGKVPDDLVKRNLLVIKGDTITVVWEKQGMMGSYELRFRLDESKRPKAVDEVLIEPDEGGKPYLGIYSLDGDALRCCFSDPGQERPTEFKGGPGPGWTLTAFRRERPSPAPAAPGRADDAGKKQGADKRAGPADKQALGRDREALLRASQIAYEIAYQIASEMAKAKGKVAPDDKKPVGQDLAKLLWEMMEKSYRPPDGKKAGRADKEALDQYREALLQAFRVSSELAKAQAKGQSKVAPEDDAASANRPAFVRAYERAQTLKKALEGQRASGGKVPDETIEALDGFLKAGKEFEQAVKQRAKARAVEQATKEIEDALARVGQAAHDRRTELETLDEIERAVRDLKKKVRERRGGE
jgi:RNA polymerase sigma-70 factor (ECF subfamily)